MNEPYQRAAIEITSSCNGKCPYCPTGRANLEHRAETPAYMSADCFFALLSYLKTHNILSTDGTIDLYNWGEPLLNPDFLKIASGLSKLQIGYSVSTNGSIVRLFEHDDDLSGLKSLIFSMPGFSQASYDRIHGFCFEKIKNNFQILLDNYRSHGFNGYCKIAFHIYQFNIGEIRAAKEFADQLNIHFYPYFAIPASYDLATGLIDGTIDKNILNQMSRELMLFYLDEMLQERPEDFQCRQEDFLTIDEKGQLLLGCCVDRYSVYAGENYVLGNITDMTLEQIHREKSRRKECTTCRHCKDIHVDYYGTNGGSKSSQILGKYLNP